MKIYISRMMAKNTTANVFKQKPLGASKVFIMSDINRIALSIYPEDWKEFKGGFKVDQNNGYRKCAIPIIEHFLSVLKSDEASLRIMLAFYRRDHGNEPDTDDIPLLLNNMRTALLCFEILLEEKGGIDNEH